MTPAFTSESDLCARFIAALNADDWTCYAETGNWDILLVRKPDGFQIGVQAKLRFTPEVITQCLDSSAWAVDKAGPDCRAVLVPAKGVQHHLGIICDYVGVTVIAVESPHRDGAGGRVVFSPQLPKFRGHDNGDWQEHAPAKRIKLPEYVPDVAAGAKSPMTLSDWKIKAIKIAVTLEKRGHLTRADFRHLSIDHRLWMPTERGWLTRKGFTFIAGPSIPNFKKMHPKVYAEIAANADAWMLKELPPAMRQASLI